MLGLPPSEALAAYCEGYQSMVAGIGCSGGLEQQAQPRTPMTFCFRNPFFAKVLIRVLVAGVKERTSLVRALG